MTLNLNFFLIDILDIHVCDGMTTYVPFATKYGQNFEEGIGSISYVTMTCPNTKTNTYFILPISEGLILVYIYIYMFSCYSL